MQYSDDEKTFERYEMSILRYHSYFFLKCDFTLCNFIISLCNFFYIFLSPSNIIMLRISFLLWKRSTKI